MWIYGASGHGKVILDCVLASNEIVEGFIDDDPAKISFLGFQVLRLNEITMEGVTMVVGIGDNQTRKKIAESLKVSFATVVHPSSVVSPRSTLGHGTVVVPQSVINSGSQIGEHCIINTKSSVDHDCIIGDFIHIAPGAIICGTVSIGSLTWIGAGAVIRENLSIGRNVIIGAGSVIVKDIPDNALVFGVPGRIIKFRSESDHIQL